MVSYEARIHYVDIFGASDGVAKACTLCPPGTKVSDDKSFCVKCPNGTFSNNGSTECKPCEKGYFADKVCLMSVKLCVLRYCIVFIYDRILM